MRYCYKLLDENIWYAYLSGTHATLPLAELKAVLEAERIDYNILEVHDQLVLFRLKEVKEGVKLATRSGYIHEVGVALAVSEAHSNCILEAVRNIDLTPLKNHKVIVKVSRIKGYSKHINCLDLTKEIAKLLTERCKHAGCSVGVRGASITLKVLLTEGIAVIGIPLDTLNVSELLERSPHKRPFFKPISLDPRLSRVFVNLSRITHGHIFLDPFCGTGGFVIEANTIANLSYSVCSEIDEELAKGALINLRYYNCVLTDVVVADATHLPFRQNSIDSIGTDPPYGRSSSTKGRRLDVLLRGFLRSALRVIRIGRYISMAIPHWINVKEITTSTNLRLIEQHFMRVHGSLTRILLVFQKVY